MVSFEASGVNNHSREIVWFVANRGGGAVLMGSKGWQAMGKLSAWQPKLIKSKETLYACSGCKAFAIESAKSPQEDRRRSGTGGWAIISLIIQSRVTAAGMEIKPPHRSESNSRVKIRLARGNRKSWTLAWPRSC
jgi:hypothetical protein